MKPIFGTVVFGIYAHHMPFAIFHALFTFIETWLEDTTFKDHLGIGFTNRSYSPQYFWIDNFPNTTEKQHGVGFQSAYQQWEVILYEDDIALVHKCIHAILESDQPDMDTIALFLLDEGFKVAPVSQKSFRLEKDKSVQGIVTHD